MGKAKECGSGLFRESCEGGSFGFDSPILDLGVILGSIGHYRMKFDVCQVIVLIGI
jgi:hypothetical protein